MDDQAGGVRVLDQRRRLAERAATFSSSFSSFRLATSKDWTKTGDSGELRRLRFSARTSGSSSERPIESW